MWNTPLPPLLLLLALLCPDSGIFSETPKLHKVVGQMLSVRCRYPPSVGRYQKKSWCKEVSAYLCHTLVTTSGPHAWAQTSRFSVWDDPTAGFFIVYMHDLREEDSGHYWCRALLGSRNSDSKSVRFYLAVSPASTSSQATQMPHNLVSTCIQSCASPTGRIRETTVTSTVTTSLSLQQNHTICSSPAAVHALVPTLCSFLAAKSLVLSTLLIMTLRSQSRQRRESSLKNLSRFSPQDPDRWLLSLRTRERQPVTPKNPEAPP